MHISQLQLQNAQLVAADGEDLMQIASADLQQLRYDRRQLQVLYLELADAKLFGRREQDPGFKHHAWTGEIALLRVNQLLFDRADRELDIASVEATRPRGILVRDQEGNFPIRKRLEVFSTQGEPAPAAAAPSGRAFHYRIGELYIDQGRFVWVDHAGIYEAYLPVRQVNLLLRNISSHVQDPPALLLVNARPGGLGELQLAGNVDLRDDKTWDTDLLGYLVAVNLIPASPYMAQLLGYKILQGQLDALVNIQIDDNIVDAHADMVLNRIKVRRVRDREHLDVQKTLIPLDIALWLLKDGRGNVRFSMPVTGELYDPQFSFSFIFSHLLQRAIMEALLSYFTPIGFYTLARLAWGRFRAVRFDPVPFDPGSSELSAEGEEQLQEAVAKMQERPDARPGICGVSNARDWAALYPHATPGMNGSRELREDFYRHPPEEIHKELERLAELRSRSVQRFLLQSGFTAQNFIQCAPDYNGRDFGKPRVELSN